MKKIHVVTCPQVERALAVWVRHMEDNWQETMSGTMLRAKCTCFKKCMDISTEQRLEVEG
ncbi:hypothetical protein BDV98DRAFT_641112, partial [Pterulicium gracile]